MISSVLEMIEIGITGSKIATVDIAHRSDLSETKKKNWSFPFVTPPSTLCAPQFQCTCRYIVNQYVRIWHVPLGGANDMRPLSWGAQTQKIRFLKANQLHRMYLCTAIVDSWTYEQAVVENHWVWKEYNRPILGIIRLWWSTIIWYEKSLGRPWWSGPATNQPKKLLVDYGSIDLSRAKP